MRWAFLEATGLLWRLLVQHPRLAQHLRKVPFSPASRPSRCQHDRTLATFLLCREDPADEAGLESCYRKNGVEGTVSTVRLVGRGVWPGFSGLAAGFLWVITRR